MSYYGPPSAPPGPPKPSSHQRDPRFDGGYRPTNEGRRACWDNATLGVHDPDDRRRGARATSATTHRHRHFHQPQQQPNSNAKSSHYHPSESYVNLKLGSHLHKVHPLPIHPDQITVVSSLFGYERNETMFAELREEWGPVFRHKYGHSLSGTDALTTEDVALPGDGTLTASRDLVKDVMAGRRIAGPTMTTTTTATTPGHPMGPDYHAHGVLPTPTPTTSGVGCSITNGSNRHHDNRSTASDDDHWVDDEADAAVPAKTLAETIVQRVCQYFSMDPSRASVTVALRYGTVDNCHPRRAHPYGARGDDCFAVASFGAPRKLVLEGRHNVRYELELSNNTVIAMMGDVTNQLGWSVGIDNVLDEEEGTARAPRAGQRPKPSDRETITVFIHGRCRAMSTKTKSTSTQHQHQLGSACGTAAGTAMPPPAAGRSRVVTCSVSTHEEHGDECECHDAHQQYQSLKEDLDKSFMGVADGSKGYDRTTSEELETHAV